MKSPVDGLTELAVDALAVRRLARLVTRDYLVGDYRERVVRAAYRRDRRGEDDGVDGRVTEQLAAADSPFPWTEWAHGDQHPPKLAKLVTCGWCASVWVGLGVVVARRAFPETWGRLARALALAQVAGAMGEVEDRLF